MVNKWWRSFTLIGMLVGVMLMSGCGNDEKVGVVDFERIARESGQAQQITQEIMTKQAEIATRLQQAQATSSPEEFAVTEQTAKRELQVFQMAKQQQFQALITSQSQLIAKEKKLGIIMHKNAVHYQGVDVTEELLAKLKANDNTNKKQNQEAQPSSAEKSGQK